MKTGWIGALLIVATALSSCAGDDDDAALPSPPTAAPSATVTTPPSTTTPTVATVATVATQAVVTTAPAEARSNSLTYVAEEDSVLAVVGARDDTTRFMQLVAALGDDAVFRQERGLTLIVPVDSAWEAFGADEFAAVLQDPNAVALLLSEHLAIGVFNIDELLATGALATAMARTLPVVDSDGVITIGGATVIEADLTADNGVVHLIDAVIEP